jgi:hypothetical protein
MEDGAVGHSIERGQPNDHAAHILTAATWQGVV